MRGRTFHRIHHDHLRVHAPAAARRNRSSRTWPLLAEMAALGPLQAAIASLGSPEILVALLVIAGSMVLWRMWRKQQGSSVERMVGLEFDDADTERAYREQPVVLALSSTRISSYGLVLIPAECALAMLRRRQQDIVVEGKQYLNIVPLTATAFLLTGQYPLFFFAVSCLPFFWVPIPWWAWQAIGVYPGTFVQILSWHYLDAGGVPVGVIGPAMALTMACQANGRVCFPYWSGFAVQQAIVLVCQARFAWRATGGATGGDSRHFTVVVSLFVIVTIWTLQHHFIMLRDRRKSFLRLHRNRKLQGEVATYAKAVDVMGKGLIVADAARKILHVNKTYCDITGFAKEDVVGIDDFVEKCCFTGQWTDKRETDAIAKAIEAGLPFVGELRAYRADGTEWWCELTVRPVRDEKTGAVEQFIATIDDVTEKVRQSHIIYSQKMFIGSQAKLTADSAFGAARSLAEARAMIASQSAENAMLTETIEILREELAVTDARAPNSVASGSERGDPDDDGDDEVGAMAEAAEVPGSPKSKKTKKAQKRRAAKSTGKRSSTT